VFAGWYPDPSHNTPKNSVYSVPLW
jgi:hypothetical protein